MLSLLNGARVKNKNKPLGMQKTIPLDFKEEQAREGRHFKLIVAAVIWLKYCRYDVKTLSNSSQPNTNLFDED